MPHLTTDDVGRYEDRSTVQTLWGAISINHPFVTGMTENILARATYSGIVDEYIFAYLVEKWNAERGPMSSVSEMVDCPSYREIIKMGHKALPLIIAHLRHNADDPDHWFAALEAITGEDPVPEAAWGDTAEMARAWLAWAEKGNIE